MSYQISSTFSVFFTNAFLKTTVRNNISVLNFIVHYLLDVSAPIGGHLQVKCKNTAAYGGFKKSISGYTHNRMQNPTIKFCLFADA
jgi:hypothetical protein